MAPTDKSVKLRVCVAKVAKRLILAAILDFIKNIGIELLLTFVASFYQKLAIRFHK